MPTTLLQVVVILALFATVVASFGAVGRWADGNPPRFARRRAVPSAEVAQARPIEAVAADVRRLTRQLALVPAGAPMARRRGLWAAYDDVLIEAARLLDVPHRLHELPDPPSRARDIEQLRLLAALQDAGLVVRL
jgi:hypothetical protein